MNKLKELETQYKAIKPPEQDTACGINFKVNQQGILLVSDVNQRAQLTFDDQQTQAVFDYLKGLGYT